MPTDGVLVTPRPLQKPIMVVGLNRRGISANGGAAIHRAKTDFSKWPCGEGGCHAPAVNKGVQSTLRAVRVIALPSVTARISLPRLTTTKCIVIGGAPGAVSIVAVPVQSKLTV